VPASRFPSFTRRLGVAFVALAIVGATDLAVQANATAQDASEPTNDRVLVELGEQLYGAHCALCHGGQGVGLDEPGPSGGPPLIGVGAASVDFMLRTGRMPATDQRHRLERKPPAFDATEREALIAYITSLGDGGGPAIPDVDGWEDAGLAAGLKSFTSNCAACHGPTAAGIAVGQRDVSPALDVVTPLEIAEAIRTGPGVMPVFSQEVMSDEEMQEVVAWIMDLRDRESPGGLQFGRSGPVTEGVIAWILGFGVLGVVMYLLGEKTGDAPTHGDPDA